MNYSQAIDYLTNLSSIEQKRPDIERIEKFLLCNGSPQNTFHSLHIGGTNGKGSTVAMLDSMLNAGGLKTGRFIGPHILRLNERIHIYGQPIEDNEFARRVTDLKIKTDLFAQQYPQYGHLSWFEFITALAFFCFAQHKVDIAVIEVGMGGIFDATNTLQKILATGITNISLDHTYVLGDTVEKIAKEKAGIIKLGIPVVTAAKGGALDVIAQRAMQLNAKLITCDSQNPDKDQQSINESLAQIKNDLYQRGLYQYENALLALQILLAGNLLQTTSPNGSSKKITIEKALLGLKNFYWPGRFQKINSLQLILDCAHNPAGIKYLRDTLDSLMPRQPFHFIFACYRDKNGFDMLKNLIKPDDHIYLLAELAGERTSFNNKDLAEYAKKITVNTSLCPNMANALAEAKTKRNPNEFIIGTGSFSVVKAIMQTLGWKTVEEGLN